jgi:hypothetical protein
MGGLLGFGAVVVAVVVFGAVVVAVVVFARAESSVLSE